LGEYRTMTHALTCIHNVTPKKDCRLCRNDQHRKYYRQHRERMLVYSTKYRERNKEKINERRRPYNAEYRFASDLKKRILGIRLNSWILRARRHIIKEYEETPRYSHPYRPKLSLRNEKRIKNVKIPHFVGRGSSYKNQNLSSTTKV
jgi:hypothetical protein